MTFLHNNAAKNATNAAIKNDIIIPGPALFPATVPLRKNIPAP